MSFFESLQNSAFTDWFLGSESIWAYPTVLTLHTVGLAALVGASAVLELRVLGVGAVIPFARLRGLYRIVWPAFTINLLSGLVLFVTQAADRITQPLFYLKLGSVALALWFGYEAKRRVYDAPVGPALTAATRRQAVGALAFWALAIVFGRLMAYFSGS